MNALDLQGSENARKEYAAWLNHPMTKIVVDILRMEGRVQLPPQAIVRAENALIAAGQNDGWHQCIDRILTLAEQQQQVPEEPKATFGAEEILKEQGLNKPK